jgi:RHS repeat-associated protein
MATLRGFYFALAGLILLFPAWSSSGAVAPVLSSVCEHKSRASYLNPTTGRFWTQDSYEGNQSEPLSLHKYLYAANNPANVVDPSGLVPIVSNFIYGNLVHEKIGEHFFNSVSGSIVDQPVSSILEVPFIPYLTASRPDLVKLPQSGRSGKVYEIKPVGSFIEGRVQLEFYLRLLRFFDLQGRSWEAGSIADYCPPQIIELKFGVFAFVLPPANGVILYEVEDMRLTLTVLASYMAAQIQADLEQAVLVNTLAPVF